MAASTPTAGKGRVRALYSYSYEDDNGQPIKMDEGEQFWLIKKTNEQWWNVKRLAKTKTKSPSIYVPANYVEEISDSDDDAFEDAQEKLSQESPKLQKPDMICVKTGAFPKKEQNRLSTFGAKASSNKPSSASGSSRGDPDSDPGLLTPDEDGSDDTSQPTHTDQSHEYMNLADIQAHIKVKTSPEPPPPPKPGKSLPVKTFPDGWEMHIDPSRNRPFYYNKLTSETSWKPPRFSPKKDESDTTEDTNANVSNTKDTSSNGVSLGLDANGKPLPQGWITEVNDNDEKQYINTSTDERWFSSVDASGKTYYYKQNSSDSMWELPEVEPVRHNSIDSAIRELEESFKKELQDLLQVPGPDGAVSLIVKSSPEESLQVLSPSEAEMKPPTPGPIMVQSFPKDFPRTSNSPRESVISPLGSSPVTHSTFGHSPMRGSPILQSPLREAHSSLRERDFSRKHSPLRETQSMMIPHDSLMLQLFPGMLDRDSAPGQGSRESLMVQSMTGLRDSAVAPGSPKESKHFIKKEQKKPSDKKGALNKTKIIEAGKKITKKWNQTYIVLSGSNLLFYKDAKAAQKSPTGKPETVIDMSTAEIDWGNKETSSRKNVLQITSDGAVFLLQTEDGPKIQEWNVALKQAQEFASQLADKLPPPEASKPPSKAPPPVSKMKRSKSTKIKGVEDSSHPKSKIRERLMNLLTRRPTRDSLTEKGIIKEQIFGSTISEVCERENSTIPRFVMDCVAAIETRGLSTDGIYRLSGNLAQVQKLRFAVDTSTSEAYNLNDPQWDFHVLTGALKLFFRELKEPLFPFEFYDKLKFAIMLTDKSKKLQTMRDLVKVLPKTTYDTTKLLFKHLNDVMNQSSQNRMQTQNIAIVFGPTLLWPKDEAPNMAVSTVFQNQIVEYILLEYKVLFS